MWEAFSPNLDPKIVIYSGKIKKTEEIFASSVTITKDGKRHLGAATGSADYKDECCRVIVPEWIEQLENLTNFAKSHPQAACVAMTKTFNSKFTYFMRTINGFEEYTGPIDDSFLPTLFYPDTTLDQNLLELFSLSTKNDVLGIPCLRWDSAFQFEASKLSTERLGWSSGHVELMHKGAYIYDVHMVGGGGSEI